MEELKQSIKSLAEVYSANLKEKIEARQEEMKADGNAHYLVYRVLGISTQEGLFTKLYRY
ncbi:MAG: ApaLI family restriction endonuclease [Phycisphaerales bacterium]|nr:ApaLI family restriction endonuclease [Phycisphaerales bacterium]